MTRVRPLFLIAASLALAACTKPDNGDAGKQRAPSGTDTPATSGARRDSSGGGTSGQVVTAGDEEHNDSPQAPPRPGVRKYAGQLPHDLSYYKTHGVEFRDIVRRVSWIGWDRVRKCKGKAGCADGSVRAKMRVQAIEDSHEVPLEDLPDNGVIVGRMYNISTETDFTTGVPAPSGPWYEEYYFVITEWTTGRAHLNVVRLTFDQYGNPNKNTEIYSAVAGYASCKDGHVPVKAIGDFKDCPMFTPQGASADSAAAAKSGAVDRGKTTLDASPWFSCVDGCCSAQWPPLIGAPKTASAR